MNRKKNIFQQAYVYMHINAITVYVYYYTLTDKNAKVY